jgi:hypothetical protein
MNENHVIDSWIAELGLSSRRFRRVQELQLDRDEDAAGRPGRRGRRPSPPALTPGPLASRYRMISSPC